MAAITFSELKREVTQLAKNATKGADAIRAEAQAIDAAAQDTRRVAEQIASMGVDQETRSETHHLAKLMAGVSEAAIDYASAGDTTAKAAQASHDQAQTTHGGIQAAYQRSPVDLSNVNREWFRQS
ncbi:hypothetical protein [Streptomyces sp. NPDC058657]|uniref:hypothetical protein n=1 Tax=unclassified Streptomyces TaxID=2593676 RepID=UPI003667C8CD